MMDVTACAAHSPIINHIIMLCGFESNGVFVEYINQQGWSELSHVTSLSLADVNAFHTVENNGWTFKERPLDKDLQVFKGFLLYHARITRKLNQLLDAEDVTMLITKSVFDCYLSSEDYQVDMLSTVAARIPSFDEMARTGVFHIEQVRIASVEESKEDTNASCCTTTVNNMNPEDFLFVTSWTIDEVLNDTTVEYEVLFDAEDDSTYQVTYSNTLITDCVNVINEVLVINGHRIKAWGATTTRSKEMASDETNLFGQAEVYGRTEKGENMFVVYKQRMLIVIFDSARVFDPGGDSTKEKKYQHNLCIKQ